MLGVGVVICYVLLKDYLFLVFFFCYLVEDVERLKKNLIYFFSLLNMILIFLFVLKNNFFLLNIMFKFIFIFCLFDVGGYDFMGCYGGLGDYVLGLLLRGCMLMVWLVVVGLG